MICSMKKRMSGSVTAEQNLYKGLSSSGHGSQAETSGCEKARQAEVRERGFQTEGAASMPLGWMRLGETKETRDCHVARVSRARRLGV